MNKVTFRCKRSGNTVSFVNAVDIESTRKHEGYTEIKDVETDETIQSKKTIEKASKEVLKLKPKVGVPAFLQE